MKSICRIKEKMLKQLVAFTLAGALLLTSVVSADLLTGGLGRAKAAGLTGSNASVTDAGVYGAQNMGVPTNNAGATY